MINRCGLYKKSEESIDRILIRCEKTKGLWMFLLAIFGLKEARFIVREERSYGCFSKQSLV